MAFMALGVPLKASALNLHGQLFDPTNLVTHELDAEQIRLNMLNNRADEIMMTHARYRLVRQQYFYSDEGIVYLSDEYYTALTPWLNGLNQVRAAVVAVDDLADSENRDQIRSTLNSLMADLADLTEMHANIRKRGRLAQEHMELTRSFPLGYISEYDESLTAYNGHREQLESSIADILDRIDVAQKDSLRQTLAVTKEIFDIYLITNAIDASTEALRTALAAAQSMLDAELLVTPLTSEIFAKKLQVLNLISVHKKRFYAQTIAAEAEALANSYITQINSFDLADADKSSGITMLNTLVTEMNDYIEADDVANNGKWYRVYQLYSTAVDEVVPLCVHGIGRTIYNCQAMRSIQGLTQSAITDFTDAQLEYLENTLIAIENGPLAAGDEL